MVVPTAAGEIRVKVARRDGHVANAAPEFDDCARCRGIGSAREGDSRAGPVRVLRSGSHTSCLDRVPVRFYLTTAIDRERPAATSAGPTRRSPPTSSPRYKRLCGVDTFFLMGNDEHSQNVYKKAKEAGLDPLAYCDEMEGVFRDRWAELNVSYDDFILPAQPRHRARGASWRSAVSTRGCLRGHLRRLVLRLVRGVQAGEGPDRRQVSRPPDADARWIKETNYFFRLSKHPRTGC